MNVSDQPVSDLVCAEKLGLADPEPDPYSSPFWMDQVPEVANELRALLLAKLLLKRSASVAQWFCETMLGAERKLGHWSVL